MLAVRSHLKQHGDGFIDGQVFYPWIVETPRRERGDREFHVRRKPGANTRQYVSIEGPLRFECIEVDLHARYLKPGRQLRGSTHERVALRLSSCELTVDIDTHD